MNSSFQLQSNNNKNNTNLLSDSIVGIDQSIDKFSKPEFNFAAFVEEIMKRKILLKLQKSITFIVDGRIIRFSDLIKSLCSRNKFDYRINLETIDRQYLLSIIDFIEILEWNKEKFVFDVKAEELNNWYEINKKDMLGIESTARFLKMPHLFEYLHHREFKRLSKRNNIL